MESMKNHTYECKLCELLGEGRPESLKSNFPWCKEQIYMSLRYTHIRYIHGGWELTDGCKLTQEMDEEFYERDETCKRFNLGNCFLCVFVPRNERSCARWLVRMLVTWLKSFRHKLFLLCRC